MSEIDKESQRYYDLVYKYVENKDYDLAIETCKKLMELNPNYPKAWSLMGLVYEKLAENEKALKYYKQALIIDPNDTDALNGIKKIAFFVLMGLKCLKCGTQSSLTLYEHSELETTGSSRIGWTYYTSKIKIPICSKCKDELSRWKSKHTTKKSSTLGGVMGTYICIMIIVLIVTIPSLITNFGLILIFIPLLIPILIFFIYRIFRYNIRQQDESPFRYIKIRGKLVYVRPKGQGSWVKYNDWINSLKKV